MSWVHGACTELFDEANFDLYAHRSAVRCVYGPFFVVQDLSHRSLRYPETCLVMIAVVQDAHFEAHPNGIVTYANVPMWSREIARRMLPIGYADPEDSPSMEDMRHGQFVYEDPVFALRDVSHLSASEWRACDWITLSLMHGALQDIICHLEHWPGSCWTLFHFGSVNAEYVQDMNKVLCLARRHCPHLGPAPLPLATGMGQTHQSLPWRLKNLRSHVLMRKLRRDAKRGFVRARGCAFRKLKRLRGANQRRRFVALDRILR